MLKNGQYRTRAGSTVRISGEHSGIYEIEFDWVEENACVDCVPAVNDGYLSWHCERWGGDSARLYPVEEK